MIWDTYNIKAIRVRAEWVYGGGSYDSCDKFKAMLGIMRANLSSMIANLSWALSGTSDAQFIIIIIIIDQ